MNDTKAANSTVDGEVNYKEDLFCWTIEGVGILVIGLIGVFGNSCSMVLFSRQKVHRIFHHLLLLLSFFDLMYVVCSVLIFSISKFIEEYDVVYRIYLLPYLLPMAHVGLMGSVYCTLALTVERFLAVCYPFLKHRHSRIFVSKTFVLPVIIFTILYNVPKFFELYVKEEVMTKTLNCSEVLSDFSYEDHHENCTLYDNYNVTVPDLDENQNLRYKISIAATSLRTNQIYIRVYILWINLIFQIILPFVMLITFNILTYDKIIQFEQTLVTQIRAQNTSQRQNSVRRFREGSRSTISEYHHSGRGRGSNAASHNSAQNHNTNDNLEMIQLVSSEHEKMDDENPRNNLLTRIKSMRHGSNGSVRASGRTGTTNSSIVSGQAHSDLRRREVVLAKISLYMVFVFLICHSVKIVPNIYEMAQTYLMEYNPDTVPWPTWISRVTNISHLLLTFACSANFYIYFAKHSQRVQRLFKFRTWFRLRRGAALGPGGLGGSGRGGLGAGGGGAGVSGGFDGGVSDMQLQELDGEDEDQQTETGTNCQTVHSSINNTLSVTLNGAGGGGGGGVGTRSPSTNSSSFRNVSFRV